MISGCPQCEAELERLRERVRVLSALNPEADEWVKLRIENEVFRARCEDYLRMTVEALRLLEVLELENSQLKLTLTGGHEA